MNTDKIYAQQIAEKYAVKETSKVKALKKLDTKVHNPANIFAYTFGIVCSLIMGTGMSFAMGVIGANNTLTMVIGILIGCIGILGVSINYPIYKRILNKSKNKYATDIIKLANEIASEE